MNPMLNGGLVSGTYKEAPKLNIKNPKNPVRKWAKDVLNISMKKMHRRHINMGKVFNRYWTMQVKTTVIYDCTPVRMAEIKNSHKIKCW